MNHPSSVSSSKGRVLVVDDEHVLCDLVVDALLHFGFEAMSRTSADAALGVLASQSIDVVLSDLNMNGTSGLELCRKVVATKPDVPVVIMT